MNKVGKFSFEVKAMFPFSDFYSKGSFFFLLTRIVKAPLSLVTVAALHKIKTKTQKNLNKGC